MIITLQWGLKPGCLLLSVDEFIALHGSLGLYILVVFGAESNFKLMQYLAILNLPGLRSKKT